MVAIVLLILMGDDDFNDGRILIRTHHTNMHANQLPHTHDTHTGWMEELARNMSTAHVRMRTCTHEYTHNYARNTLWLCFAPLWQWPKRNDGGEVGGGGGGGAKSLCHTMMPLFSIHSYIVSYANMWCYVYSFSHGFDMHARMAREHSVIHFATSRAHLSRPHVSNLFLYILWVRFCCWQFLFPLFLLFFSFFPFYFVDPHIAVERAREWSESERVYRCLWISLECFFGSGHLFRTYSAAPSNRISVEP